MAPREAEAAPTRLATRVAVRLAVLPAGLRAPRLGVAVGVPPRAGEKVGRFAGAAAGACPPGVPAAGGAAGAARGEEGRPAVVAAPLPVLGAGVGRPWRRVGAVVAAVASPRLLQGPRRRVAPKAMAEEGVRRGPSAGDAVVVPTAAAPSVGGDAEGAVEGAQVEVCPRALLTGARPRVGGLVRGGPVATQDATVGVATAVAVEVPRVRRPAGAVPVGEAAVARAVAEGGDGSAVQVATLAARGVGIQATLPGQATVAKGAGRTLLAVAAGPAHPPDVADVGVGRVHVAADVRRRAGAAAVVEVAATPALASPTGDPTGAAGALEAVTRAGPLLVRRVAAGREVEEAVEVLGPGAVRLVAP